jgi:hypothetical protein
MIVNLNARDDFAKGDRGYVIGHQAFKTTGLRPPNASRLVTALQDVKAGANAWFDDQRSRSRVQR